MKLTFRERTLTPLQWLGHGLLCMDPRSSRFLRRNGKIQGVLVPKPLAQFGRQWSEWRAIKWR